MFDNILVYTNYKANNTKLLLLNADSLCNDLVCCTFVRRADNTSGYDVLLTIIKSARYFYKFVEHTT